MAESQAGENEWFLIKAACIHGLVDLRMEFKQPISSEYVAMDETTKNPVQQAK